MAAEGRSRGFGCPVRERGLRLREMCADCDGRPPSGQFRLQPKTLLCLEGSPADAFFTVVRGYLRESTHVEEGRTVGLRLLGPGEVIGAEALLGGPYRCTVESITPAVVCVVPSWQVEETLRDKPHQARTLAAVLSGQIVELRENVRRLSSMSAEEQVRSVLAEILAQSPRGSWVRLPLSRTELAEHLGLALGTVSRTIQRLARKGELEVSGRNVRWGPRAPEDPPT